MKRSFFIAAFLAVAAVGWIASGQFGHSDNLPEAKKPPADLSRSDRLPMVRIREIVAEPHQAETILRGLSQAVRMVNVKSETYGRIVELRVERGDLVENGQILARLAPESRPARLAEAQALQAQRRIEYEAAKKLSAKGYRAETSLAGSKAQLEAASAAVRAAQVALDDIVVKAPFAGIVDDRMVEIGDYLETGDGLVQLVDLDPILIVAQVNERDISLLQVGQIGSARLTTGARVEGILRFISNVADATTRTFRVELEVANPKAKIPDGVTAELRLTSPHIPAHHVSPAILTLDDRGVVGVKTLTADHRVRFVPVTIIESDAAGLWLSGLSERAVVITVGQDFVNDGQKVRPIDGKTLRPYGEGASGGEANSGGDGLGSMNALIDAAMSHSRTVISALLLILVAGAIAYVEVPKEADPDINIPILYVSLTHEGISPQDAERLLIKPMEKELRLIEGVKEMRSRAYLGGGNVVLEFDAGFDADQALVDVREKVDLAKPELPDDADEPTVHEVNLSLFPVLVVALSGDLPLRTLLRLVRDLQDKVEGVSTVLSADIAGDRDELVELIVDPLALESYNIDARDIIDAVGRSNRVVAAGSLDTGLGRFAIKLPGLFETSEDILSMPVKVNGDAVVHFRDIGTLRRTFKDAEGYARINGQSSVALEISKRTGENIIETIEKVRAVVEAERVNWPQEIQVSYSQDKSNGIRTMLADLQNNVLSAVLLVMVVIVAALGLRSAGLVGIAIPGSFLTGILVLSAAGLTVNIVVLFSLILAVGMLVDGAIVVTEFADRKMSEGHDRRLAYGLAAKRMAWPIIAATATTLAAFLPLLFWPGVVGEFMKFLPITLLATLSASLVMALIFVPTLGSVFGRAGGTADQSTMQALNAGEQGDLGKITGFTGGYLRVLGLALRFPMTVLFLAIALLVAVQVAYAKFGRGVEFFPNVEPDNAVLQVHGRGNLSIDERDELMRQVESVILDLQERNAEFHTIFSTTVAASGRQNDKEAEDLIGSVQLEFTDWFTRRPANEILAEARLELEPLAGIMVEPRQQEAGPPVGKPVQIQVASDDPALIEPMVLRIGAALQQIGGFVDLEDGRPIPGIEWELRVDRAQAAKFGADVSLIGSYVRMITNGMKLGEYRPDNSTEEIDIVVRLPRDFRSIDHLDQIRVQTSAGLVPISNFVERTAKPKTGMLQRVDSSRVMTVKADVAPGLLVNTKVQEIRQWLAEQDIDPRLNITFKGEDEEQQAAQAFLGKAFGVALFLMGIILVTQFNSFYSAFLILSAVIMSTIGVMMGLLITDQPFGIVMSGIGVIALAGIVVNNNIVLIDTFDRIVETTDSVADAILRTGAQRLRPVLLTTVTTILGLLPMVLAVNIDFFERTLQIGAPSTQWWRQLSTAIVFGLSFATVLTLVVTPTALMQRAKVKAFWARRRQRRQAAKDPQATRGPAKPEKAASIAFDPSAGAE